MQNKKLNTNLQQKLLHKRRLLMFCFIYSFDIADQGELPLGRKHTILTFITHQFLQHTVKASSIVREGSSQKFQANSFFAPNT